MLSCCLADEFFRGHCAILCDMIKNRFIKQNVIRRMSGLYYTCRMHYMLEISSLVRFLAAIWDKTSKPLNSRVWFPVLVLTLLFIYAYGLLGPGRLVAVVGSQDDFILLDGIYRIWEGQKPHLDFVSALGALNFIGPAFISWSSYPEIALLQFNVVALGLVLLIGMYICYSRLGFLESILLILFLAAIVGAPVNIGVAPDNVSHNMLYNRIGWAAAILLLLMAKSPGGRYRWCLWVDGIISTFLLISMLYLKASYFVAMLGFLIVLAFFDIQWRLILLGVVLAIAVVAMLVESLAPGFHLAYLVDLKSVAAVGVGIDLWTPLRRNFLASSPVLLLLFMTPVFNNEVSRFSFNRDFWICLAILVMSLFLIANNAQGYGLPTFYVASLLLISVYPYYRKRTANELEKAVFLSILVVMTLPEVIDRQGALERFYRMAETREYSSNVGSELDRFLILSIREDRRLLDYSKINESDRNELVRRISDVRQPSAEVFLYQNAIAISSGVTTLRKLIQKYGSGSVVTLDFSNPFSYLLGTPPARGDYLWYHFGRNISVNYHLPVAQFLSGAKYIMIPNYPMEYRSTIPLVEITADYLEDEFFLYQQDFFWKIYVRNNNDF
jgi:hypothetical protein